MKLPPGYVPGYGTHKATAKGGFGERLLKQFGWTEGKGLGAKEDGMAEALKVKQKKDQTGVGAHSSGMWRDKWWEDAYAQSVSGISGVSQADIDRVATGDSSDSDDSTADVPAARQVHADGTQSSATAAEQKLAAQLAKDPWGRFGGRQGKLARLRAQEEAALAARQAVAGTAVVAAPVAAPKARKLKKRKEPEAATDAAAVPATKVPKVKRKKGAKLAAAAASVCKLAEPDALATARAQAETARIAESVRNFVKTPAAGWWGAKRFISVGALGSAAEEREGATNERTAFTEDTQEGLYMALHNAKSSGKTGLGKGKGSGVIGGAKWEGKKVCFDEEAAAAAEDTSAQTAYDSPAEADSAAAPSSAPCKAFKYNKAIRKALQQADGQSLTLKQLVKQLKQQWTLEHGPPPAAASLKATLLSKAEKLSHVAVGGKRISLV